MSLSPSNFVNEMRQSDSYTHNGAITHSTTLNSVLDLFFLAGACRDESEENIKGAVERALAQDEKLALRCIFWAGDIRGGAGERRFFKIALKHIYDTRRELFYKIFHLVPEFSRWDVLFDYDDERVYRLIGNNLGCVINPETYFSGNTLLAKWMTRRKQHNNFASRFRKYYGISARDYRQRLSTLSKIVETNLCQKRYDFDYSHVPSVAFKKYNKAFRRNDEKRFTEFLEKVNNGEKKIHAGAIFPHDLYKSFIQNGDTEAIRQQWNCLPNYLENSSCKFLPVCDVSGSMDGDPMAISVALGCYLSERNKSIFKDAFITFSRCPQMQYLQGDIISRFRQLRRAEWEMNTDLQAVFDLILSIAIRGSVSKEDMPTHILIISDMEFDSACKEKTNYEVINQKYQNAGFEFPNIVFWNVNGRVGNCPVSIRDGRTALISGASPQIVKSVISGNINPVDIMLKALNIERYNCVNE